jgi:TolA-binding protein
LYKRALVLRSAGQTAAARAALERIVRDYPRSDEAALARDQLRTLGR